MLTLPAVVILTFAAYRSARLFTADTFSEGWRLALYGWAWSEAEGAPRARAPWRSWVYEGATCALCVGVWAAGALYLLWRYGGAPSRGLIVVLAVAGGQAFLALHEPSVQ